MVILSLFDGISCGRVALDRAKIKVDKYFASEIDENAIKIAKANYKDTIEIGDITKVYYKDKILYTENGNFNIEKIDIVMGGSPCQNFSSIGYSNGMTSGSVEITSLKQYLDLKNKTALKMKSLRQCSQKTL